MPQIPNEMLSEWEEALVDVADRLEIAPDVSSDVTEELRQVIDEMTEVSDEPHSERSPVLIGEEPRPRETEMLLRRIREMQRRSSQ